MEKLTPVGNYLNNRMRRMRTGDLSPKQRGGEVFPGRVVGGISYRGNMVNIALVLYHRYNSI